MGLTMEPQEPENDFEHIFSLRREEIGRTAMPVQSENPRDNAPRSKKKEQTVAIFFDASGNRVEPDDKNMSYGEIWQYDKDGRITRTYVGDAWTTDEDYETSQE